MKHGTEEGQTCFRDGCEGHIELSESEDCACHISPPCSACVSRVYQCDECGWTEEDEPATPFVPSALQRAVVNHWTPRTLADLDKTKIDWISGGHSNSSMTKEGVFPIGTSAADVRKEVDGTFGGRFDRFNADAGTFKFIAYTD